MDSSAKLTWILVISATSFFGTLFYLYTKSNIGSRATAAGYNKLIKDHKDDIIQDEADIEELESVSNETADLVHYLNRSGTFPVTAGNRVTYYPLGENKWEAMLEDLKKAEKFIFMEYFIIAEGKMRGSILHILAEKVKQGVEVRVMYDGTCALALLPYDYPKRLAKYGIKCKMFSPLLPFLSTHYNYRDHRKILVIDGKVGFNGGVNLGDEYINHVDHLLLECQTLEPKYSPQSPHFSFAENGLQQLWLLPVFFLRCISICTSCHSAGSMMASWLPST